MKRRTILTTLLTFMALYGNQARAQGEGWWDDLFECQETELAAVIAKPQEFRHVDLQLTLQFNEITAIHNPYHTPFERDDFVSFSAWNVGAALWNKTVHDSSYSYLFLSRTSAQAAALLKMKKYQRIRVKGRVRSISRGRPWIEVRSFEPLKGALTEPSLIHLVKAKSLQRLRRFDAAASEFALAFLPTLPVSVQIYCLKGQAGSLSLAGRHPEALRALENALKIHPEDPSLRKACKAARKMVPNRKRKAPIPSDKRLKRRIQPLPIPDRS